jgi:hypothetical protein
MMVKAESLTSILNAISPALRKARAVFAQDWAWLDKDGKLAHEPQPYEHFEPPIL